MGVGPLGSGAGADGGVVMLTTPRRGVPRLTIAVARVVASVAAAGLLAGFLWADGPSRPGSATLTSDTNGQAVGNGVGADGTGANGTNGSNGAAGAGGNGGTSGAGGNGTGGTGVGGNGGSANGGAGGTGGTGGNGGAGTPGADGVSGTAGASGSADSNGVTGSGHLVSQTIALPGVTSVIAGASFVVHLTVGDTEQATIRLDDNLTGLVDATVREGTLRLGLKPGSNVRNAALSAEVTVRHLDQLTTSGASHVTLVSAPTGPALQLTTSGASQVTGPVRVDHLDAAASGASILTLSGQVGALRLSAAGDSQLFGAGLTIADLDVLLSGASQANVVVSGTLAVTAAGASVLRHRGNPTITRQQVSGTSSIVTVSP